MTDRPVGAPVDFTPPDPACPRTPMEGRYVRLEPADPARHAADLYADVEGEDWIWTYMSHGPFASLDDFRAWLEGAAALDDPMAFTVVDRATGRAEGIVCFLRITPAHGVIEIGGIWFVPALQRTAKATEAIFLTMKRSFEELGYRRLEWKCDHLNAASRRAALRFGFTYEGIFRQHMIYKGRNRDTAWYAIIDTEWPAIRAGFEAWLDPANFDGAGRQRRALGAFLAQRRE